MGRYCNEIEGMNFSGLLAEIAKDINVDVTEDVIVLDHAQVTYIVTKMYTDFRSGAYIAQAERDLQTTPGAISWAVTMRLASDARKMAELMEWLSNHQSATDKLVFA